MTIFDNDEIDISENEYDEGEGDDSIHVLFKFLKLLSLETLDLILMDIMNLIVSLGGFQILDFRGII
jgi:hypothetical protein